MALSLAVCCGPVAGRLSRSTCVTLTCGACRASGLWADGLPQQQPQQSGEHHLRGHLVSALRRHLRQQIRYGTVCSRPLPPTAGRLGHQRETAAGVAVFRAPVPVQSGITCWSWTFGSVSLLSQTSLLTRSASKLMKTFGT